MSIFEKHPKKTLSILLFIFIVITDITAANLFSALGLYKPQYKIERYYRVKNDVFHHTLAANISQSDAKWGALGYSVNTNSLGFKDSQPRQISLDKKHKRILLIGDSFTEGIGYPYNETFAGIIASKLKPQNIEVFNAGVSSYSPIIYFRKTQHLIEQGFQFDELVVFIDISDIENEAKHYTFDKNNNVIDGPNAKSNKLDQKLKRFITENTILLSNLRILIRKFKAKTTRPREFNNSLNVHGSLWTVKKEVYNEYAKDGLPLAKKHMTMLSDLLKKHNIKLTIAVYPWPDQIMNRDINSIQVTFWEDWSKKNNVKFINLFPNFINSISPEKIIKNYFILGDVHWNKEGHKLIAESVLPQL